MCLELFVVQVSSWSCLRSMATCLGVMQCHVLYRAREKKSKNNILYFWKIACIRAWTNRQACRFVMLQAVEPDIRDERICELEEQCDNNELRIHMLEVAYKISLGETNVMEIRFNEEQIKVVTCLNEIATLKDKLRHIKTLATHASIILYTWLLIK